MADASSSDSGHRAPTPIGVAIVAHANRYLVGVRGAEGPLAGFAEFPGGKCRPGEPPADCAVRECAEETGLRVEIIELLDRREFHYPHATVDLHFFLCRPSHPDQVQTRHKSFEWILPAQLRDLNFPPANQPVIELLRARTDRCSNTS